MKKKKPTKSSPKSPRRSIPTPWAVYPGSRRCKTKTSLRYLVHAASLAAQRLKHNVYREKGTALPPLSVFPYSTGSSTVFFRVDLVFSATPYGMFVLLLRKREYGLSAGQELQIVLRQLTSFRR